jgi:hypothetical protein
VDSKNQSVSLYTLFICLRIAPMGLSNELSDSETGGEIS